MALSGTCMHLCVLFDAFMTLLSWITQVIKDGAYLASGEILAIAVIAGGFQLLKERGIPVDPAHQMAGCRAGVAVGKVEHGKLLFAVTSYLHIDFV